MTEEGAAPWVLAPLDVVADEGISQQASDLPPVEGFLKRLIFRDEHTSWNRHNCLNEVMVVGLCCGDKFTWNSGQLAIVQQAAFPRVETDGPDEKSRDQPAADICEGAQLSRLLVEGATNHNYDSIRSPLKRFEKPE